jgi:hydrogenase maturation protease
VTAAAPKVLVAGVGNIFLGDDGFGVEVAGRLAGQQFPEGVKVADFGIGGVHLAFELMNDYEAAILVDATPRGGAPGTLYVLEPEVDDDVDREDAALVDAHGMEPDSVLALLGRLGGSVGRVMIVGCEPASVDEGMGLSPPVAGAVDGAVEAVHELLSELAGRS